MYTILTGRRNAIIEFCQVTCRHVVHKHELHGPIMTRTFSKASELFECIEFLFIRHVG